MITLERHGVFSGHKAVITINESEPESRAELAKTVTKLLKEGNAVFVTQGKKDIRISGYDAKKNQWIEAKTDQRVEAKDKDEATSIAPISGG